MSSKVRLDDDQKFSVNEASKASTYYTVLLFKSVVGNRISRSVLKSFLTYCKKDEDTRLNTAIKVYAGAKSFKDVCFQCKLASLLVKLIIKFGAKSFGGANESQLKEALKDTPQVRGFANIIKGLAEFGVRKPFVSGAPILVVWDVTYTCNLKCKHCYANAGIKLQNELTTEEAKKAIDTFYKAGVVAIAWSGGEPLLRKDIFELSKYAYDKGIYIAMATNGTLIDEGIAQKLWDSGVRFLQISLDSTDPAIHDEFRGVKGAWEKTVNAIKITSKMGFFVNVAMTVTKFNLKDVKEMIDFSEQLGAKWFMVYNFVPTGRGRQITEMDLSPEEREALLKMLYGELKNPSRKIEILTTAPQYSRIALMEEGNSKEFIFPTHFANAQLGNQLISLADFIGGCGAGRYYIAMKANGDIQPCVFLPIKVGNIKELYNSFEEWWKNNKILNDLRNKDILKENCGSCPFRYVCGGCRARAYAYFGDYLAPDPGCINNKEVYESLVEKVKVPQSKS